MQLLNFCAGTATARLTRPDCAFHANVWLQLTMHLRNWGRRLCHQHLFPGRLQFGPDGSQPASSFLLRSQFCWLHCVYVKFFCTFNHRWPADVVLFPQLRKCRTLCDIARFAVLYSADIAILNLISFFSSHSQIVRLMAGQIFFQLFGLVSI